MLCKWKSVNLITENGPEEPVNPTVSSGRIWRTLLYLITHRAACRMESKSSQLRLTTLCRYSLDKKTCFPKQTNKPAAATTTKKTPNLASWKYRAQPIFVFILVRHCEDSSITLIFIKLYTSSRCNDKWKYPSRYMQNTSKNCPG